MSIRKGSYLIASGSSLNLDNFYTKTQIDTKDSNCVHKTGDETIAGTKTFSSTIHGTITTAMWADLAEMYQSDDQYPVGTLIKFGGEKDITVADGKVNGVISDKPGFLLHYNLEDSQPVALVGKTPIRIIGKVKRFDNIILSDTPGIGIASEDESKKVIAIALESSNNEEEKLVMCVTKFTL